MGAHEGSRARGYRGVIIMIASMSFGPTGYMLGFLIALVVVGISQSQSETPHLGVFRSFG
jgi:hypothetical protein